MKRQTGKWIIGVSGGADSMALLDMCYKQNMDIIVAHVNYQKRETANRDEKGVKKYCQERGIPFFVRCVVHYEQGNFQAQARNIRYRFFKELLHEFGARGVFVAHHQDDVLETYMMQKERKSIPDYYGIKQSVILDGLLVERPLLSYTKQELVTYCQSQGVYYTEDESNLDTTYTRNRIRHQIVSKLSAEERSKLLYDIQVENKHLHTCKVKVEKIYDQYREIGIPISVLLDLPIEVRAQFFQFWVSKKLISFRFSKRALQEIERRLLHHSNWQYQINEHVSLSYEYGTLFLREKEAHTYAYKMEVLEYIKQPYFYTSKQGRKIEGLVVHQSDFPIIIRNAKAGDKIQLRYGTKKVHRFFIDRKIMPEERKTWPVVVNNVGKVIYVYGIGCDIEHYGNNFNLFVLK